MLAGRWVLERGVGEEGGDGDWGGERMVWKIEVVRIKRSEVGEGVKVGIMRRGRFLFGCRLYLCGVGRAGFEKMHKCLGGTGGRVKYGGYSGSGGFGCVRLSG